MKYVEHYSGERKQERTTPKKLFQDLNLRFQFTMDGAALPENSLCSRFSSESSPLPWTGERVFCNPPWSSIGEFIRFGPDAEFACFLVPARTNVKWFHTALHLGAVPEFFYGRPKFDGLKSNSPVDCLLLKFGREAPCTHP